MALKFLLEDLVDDLVEFFLLPFTPPTAFALENFLARRNTTRTITTMTMKIRMTIRAMDIQNPVAFCYSPSVAPNTHALFCVPM